MVLGDLVVQEVQVVHPEVREVRSVVAWEVLPRRDLVQGVRLLGVRPHEGRLLVALPRMDCDRGSPSGRSPSRRSSPVWVATWVSWRVVSA